MTRNGHVRGPLLVLLLLIAGAAVWRMASSGSASGPDDVSAHGPASDAAQGDDAGPLLEGSVADSAPPSPESGLGSTSGEGETTPAGHQLLVRLQMPDGTPLPGFGVRVKQKQTAETLPSKRPIGEGVSGEDGRVRFDGLLARYIRVEAGFVENVTRKDLELSGSGPTEVVLECEPTGVQLTGTVTRSGQPVPGGDVAVRGRDSRQFAVWARMKTTEDGTFRAVLREGRYTLLVAGAPCDTRIGRGFSDYWVPGGAGPWLLHEPLTLDGSRSSVHRDLQITPTRLTVDVTRAGSGEPVRDARVFVTRSEAPDDGTASKATDAKGHVGLDDLPLGELRVRVVHRGSVAMPEQRIVLGEDRPTEELSVALSRAASLVLRARDAQGAQVRFGRLGRPVVLHLDSRQSYEGKPPPSKAPRPARWLAYGGLPPGRVRVSITDTQEDGRITYGLLGPPQERVLDLRAGERKEWILEGVEARTAVYLAIRLPQGKPAPRARIELRDAEGGLLGQTRRDGLRWNWMGYAPPGTYRLHLDDGQGHEWQTDLEVSGETVHRNFSVR